jgi:TPR repeat protein
MMLTTMAGLGHANGYDEGFLAAESGDYKLAKEQWQPLAERGHAIAQFNLALLYHSGLGVPADEAKAVSLYLQSAKNGYNKAQEFLAAGYREGWFGLPKDSRQADYWERRLESGL